MQQENIRYVLVWSGWLRLSHWLIAAGVLFQIFSAWALKHDVAGYEYWLDWHLITGQIIAMALGLRVILLFVPVGQRFPVSGNWRAFVPEAAQLRAMLQMIKFYISFSRYPLPNWYAHNPLWLPLYLLMFLVLAGCVISGLLYDTSGSFFTLPMFELHGALASLIIFSSLLHIITVFLHDLKGKGAFISAMVNGFRYFHHAGMVAGEQGNGHESHAENQVISVSVDSIKKKGSE